MGQNIRIPTRPELAAFLRSPETLRTVEALFGTTDNLVTITDALQALVGLMEAAPVESDAQDLVSEAAADAAALVFLPVEDATPDDMTPAAIDAALPDDVTPPVSVEQGQDDIAPPATAEALQDDLAPREEIGTLAAQDADAVAITGGAVTASLTDSTSTLIASSSTLSDGAAAAAGTLTNAPTAGDPTKWVAIDDNGTTRYIPAW